MALLLQAASYIIGLGSLICWVMEIIAAFKNEEKPILGILSIVPCLGLGGLIIGWMKHKEWGITQVMIIWTGLILVSIAINVAAAVIGLGAAGGAVPGGVPAGGGF